MNSFQGTPLEHCPACNARSADERGAAGDLRLVHCRTCDLTYLDPQPIEMMRARYLYEYDLALHFAELEARKRVLFQRRLEMLGPPPHDAARLCDVGCGDGLFLEMAREQGWVPFGIELNPPAAKAARNRGLMIFEGAVEELDDLPWETFSAVCSWDAIEHTPTPRVFAERAAALMRSDGRLLLSTLNVDSLVARLRRMNWGMIEAGHFTYWNERSLRTLLERTGMVVKSVGFFGLGRDLVTYVDRLAKLRDARSRAKNRPAAVGNKTWDAGRFALLAERPVNHMLDRMKLGVGIVIEAVRR